MTERAYPRIPLMVLALALLVSVFAVQGCASGPDADILEDPTAQTSAEDAAEEPAVPFPEEEPVYTPSYVPTGDEVAVIETEKGTIRFEFYPDDAPNHVAAFIELAEKGFYDDTAFHRVEPGLLIQGGDPLSKAGDPMVGTGGPGYRLAAEFNARQHLEGTVAMARTMQSVDSAGSQFYICLDALPLLDGDYTVFGQVIEGLDVIRSIEVGDVMTSVTIENSSATQ